MISMGSLKNQFVRVIDLNFTPGLNKHSYKKQKITKQKIPSYRYRKNLINFACNLANYLTSNYSVKCIKEIKPEYITEFFQYKASDINNGKGCSHSTLIQYKSYINKLDKLIKQTYNFNAHLADGVPKKLGGNAKIRDLYIKQEHIDAILEEKSNSMSDAVLGIKINNLFGLRAEETTKLKAKDFDLTTLKLHIVNGKNGKSRDLYIDTEEKLGLAKEIRRKFDDEERIVKMRSKSFSQFISRSLVDLDIKEYKEAKTSNHALRKAAAIKEYETTRDKESTSKFLGHNRINIINTYIRSK